jgi:hypothetical protein
MFIDVELEMFMDVELEMFMDVELEMFMDVELETFMDEHSAGRHLQETKKAEPRLCCPLRGQPHAQNQCCSQQHMFTSLTKTNQTNNQKKNK